MCCYNKFVISKDFSFPYIIQTAPIAVLEVAMLTVPASHSQAFEEQLNQRNVPEQRHRDFHKWLAELHSAIFIDIKRPVVTGRNWPFSTKST